MRLFLSTLLIIILTSCSTLNNSSKTNVIITDETISINDTKFSKQSKLEDLVKVFGKYNRIKGESEDYHQIIIWDSIGFYTHIRTEDSIIVQYTFAMNNPSYYDWGPINIFEGEIKIENNVLTKQSSRNDYTKAGFTLGKIDYYYKKEEFTLCLNDWYNELGYLSFYYNE